MSSLTEPLPLPCGVTLKNRLAKASMTEGLANPRNHATERHARLYRRWSEGGAGLLLTGNVLVDRRYLERPGNAAIEADGAGRPTATRESRSALARWAREGTTAGNHLWMQLNHAGRQTPKAVAAEPVAPSAVPLRIPGAQFGPPRAMSEPEIEETIERFAHAASVARQSGFTGAQIHAAHGYLLSQFLSPRANRRTDRWGGSLENRARLLLQIVRAVRREVGPAFPVAVKLNSADFQKGGFDHEQSLAVVRWLDDEGVDLLEVSGGNYEQPRMMGIEGLDTPHGAPESTRRREAYFLRYAADVRHVAQRMRVMVTGGFRDRAAMEQAVSEGALDVVGLARPLCVDPSLPARLLRGEAQQAPRWEQRLRVGPGPLGPTSKVTLLRALNGWGAQSWFCLQLLRMGDGLEPDLRMGVLGALVRYQRNETQAARALVR